MKCCVYFQSDTCGISSETDYNPLDTLSAYTQILVWVSINTRHSIHASLVLNKKLTYSVSISILIPSAKSEENIELHLLSINPFNSYAHKIFNGFDFTWYLA